MLSIYSNLYWLTRLDDIKGVLIALMVISIILTILFAIWWAINIAEFTKPYDDQEKSDLKDAKWRIKIMVPVTIFIMFLFVLLPSRNDVIFITAGGKTIEWAQKDSSINKIPGQVTKVVTDYLQREINGIDSAK